MNINRENYEVHFIDYFDGKLDPVETGELMLFLSNNPDLDEEFKNFERITLKTEPNTFLNKESLKKKLSDFSSINSSNFDEFCIAYYEKDLKEEDEERLHNFLLKNPNRKKDFENYDKVYLKSDDSIIYKKKNYLKQSNLIRLNPLQIVAYAASIAVIIGLALLITKVNKNDLILESQNAYKIKKEQQSIANSHIESNSQQIIQKSSEKIEKGTHKTPTSNTIIQTKERIERDNIVLLNKLKPLEAERSKNSRQEIIYLDEIFISYNVPLDMNITNKFSMDAIKEKLWSYTKKLDPDNIDLWVLADNGIKGFNLLTESEVEFKREEDENGNTIFYSIKTELFAYSSSIKK